MSTMKTILEGNIGEAKGEDLPSLNATAPQMIAVYCMRRKKPSGYRNRSATCGGDAFESLDWLEYQE